MSANRTAENCRTRLTSGGWVLAAIACLALLGFGSRLEAFALLPTLALASLGTCAFLSRANLKGLSVECKQGLRARERSEATLILGLERGRGPLTSRELVLVPRPQTRGTARAGAVVPFLAAGARLCVPTVLRWSQRGQKTTLELRLESSYPLGLLRTEVRRSLACDVVVLPRLIPLPRQLREGLARMGTPSRSSRIPDRLGDWYGLRPWRPGESFRCAHWPSSLRGGNTMLAEWVKEVDVTLEVVLICSLADGPSLSGVSEAFEQAVRAAASACAFARAHGATVALTMLRPDAAERVCSRSPRDGQRQEDALALVRASPGDPWQVLSAFARSRIQMNCLVICAGGPSPRPAAAWPFLLWNVDEYGFDPAAPRQALPQRARMQP